REKAQIKVRQPLGAMFVRVADRAEEEALLRLSWQVLEELNIKQLHLMSDDSNMLAYTLKPQVKVLGPKYGPLVQKILAAFKALVRDLTHYVQAMRKRAGFNIEDRIQLSLYTGEDLASILRRHKKTLQSETLADTLSIVVDQPAPSLPDEVYREKISPRELKK